MGIVKLVLEREDVDPEIPDLSGRAVLQLGTCRRHTRPTELLPPPELPFPARLISKKIPKGP